MATQVLMPALSPTMEEGTLAKWLVKEGDTVKSGQILAEIETDKATMEFEAVDEGVVGKILVAEGTAGVKVNTPIAVLVEEGETRVGCAPAPAAAPVAAPVAAAPAVAAESVAARPAPVAAQGLAALGPARRPDQDDDGPRGFARGDGRGDAGRSDGLPDGGRGRGISGGLQDFPRACWTSSGRSGWSTRRSPRWALPGSRRARRGAD
jgi:pyruvate/2-oxoglutarate dehydrogenase complex dihydrolipoamide acyltransferase (E2) component